MSINNPIIHIGFPRTGTSWLQTNFFPFVKNCTYIPRKIIQEKLIHPSSLSFNADILRELKKNSKRVIISEEMITGRVRAGNVNHLFFKEYIGRLKRAFPNAHYILVIRNQLTAIQSMYNLYIEKGGTYKLKRFLSEEFRLQQLQLFAKEYYNYENTLNYLSESINVNNFSVFLYEDLTFDQKGFVSKLVGDFGLELDLPTIRLDPVNESLSERDLKLKRLLNHFTRMGISFKHYYIHVPGIYNITPRKGSNSSKKHSRLPNEILWLSEYYAESNQRIMERYQLRGMQTFNYPLVK